MKDLNLIIDQYLSFKETEDVNKLKGIMHEDVIYWKKFRLDRIEGLHRIIYFINLKKRENRYDFYLSNIKTNIFVNSATVSFNYSYWFQGNDLETPPHQCSGKDILFLEKIEDAWKIVFLVSM